MESVSLAKSEHEQCEIGLSQNSYERERQQNEKKAQQNAKKAHQNA